MTLEELKKAIDSSPFCVWKRDDISLTSLPNGIELRWGDKIYRVGNGCGVGVDGFHPMFRRKIYGDEGFEMMIPESETEKK